MLLKRLRVYRTPFEKRKRSPDKAEYDALIILINEESHSVIWILYLINMGILIRDHMIMGSSTGDLA